MSTLDTNYQRIAQIEKQMERKSPSISDVGYWCPSYMTTSEHKEVVNIREHLKDREFWEYNFTLLCFFLAELGEL